MELFNEMQIANKYCKVVKNMFQECVLKFDITNDTLTEGNEELRQDVLNKIENNDFIVNDYNSFLKSLYSGKRSSFLTHYTEEDFIKDKVKTYQVRGYNIGFCSQANR